MSYDAIVFDMDGVLLTGYHTDPAVYREAVREALLDFEAASMDRADMSVESADMLVDLADAFVDPADSGPVRQACDALEVPADAFWAYREHAATVIENQDIAAGEREPFPDTTVLASLDPAAGIGVVSNNRHGTVRFVVEHFGWSAHVDAVQGRHPTLDGYDRMKPDPYYLDRALDSLGAEPGATLYVGDRRSDVETADRAGTDVALLARDGAAPDAPPDPTYIVESLEELPGIVGVEP